ncbi:hypothetical protein OE88DRAFT_1649194 [Heliocybe sulcata]|uniref:Uncharacterized protein n=1 Tax=Heliocybe sulcata TaxID=5364 RepID=A0A5C3MMJ6_9AGAM|nr:hypothetical protein OE88DRAFT_1649194 [Heliocybe sulcata]
MHFLILSLLFTVHVSPALPEEEKKILEEIKSHPLLKDKAHDGLVMGNAHDTEHTPPTSAHAKDRPATTPAHKAASTALDVCRTSTHPLPGTPSRHITHAGCSEAPRYFPANLIPKKKSLVVYTTGWKVVSSTMLGTNGAWD